MYRIKQEKNKKFKINYNETQKEFTNLLVSMRRNTILKRLHTKTIKDIEDVLPIILVNLFKRSAIAKTTEPYTNKRAKEMGLPSCHPLTSQIYDYMVVPLNKNIYSEIDHFKGYSYTSRSFKYLYYSD